MDKFDFSKLKRKYTTHQAAQEKVLPRDNTQYIEFDNPIDVVLTVNSTELHRTIGLISPYGMLYVGSDCYITVQSPWTISCEGYGEITPYDDQFKFMEWAKRIKEDVDSKPVILSDEEDLVI